MGGPRRTPDEPETWIAKRTEGGPAPEGAGEPGKVRGRRPRYRSVWFSSSGEAPRPAWGRTGGTAPGDDDQAGGEEKAGSPPPTSGLERPAGARRPGVARGTQERGAGFRRTGREAYVARRAI